MVPRGGAPSVPQPMPARKAATSWIAIIFLVVLTALIILAHTRGLDLGQLIVIAASLTLTFLFLLFPFIRIADGPQQRSTTLAWLIAVGCLSAALMSLLRARQTYAVFLRMAEFVFAAAALLPTVIVFQKWRERASTKTTDSSDLMLAGSGTILIALIVDAIAAYCPYEDCVDPDEIYLNVTHAYGLFFLCFAVLIAARAWIGRDRMPRLLSSEFLPAIFAYLTLVAGLWDLRFRLTQLLWLAGTVMTLYAVYLGIRAGSSVGKYVAPERLLSGLGAAALAGLALCDISLYLKWISYGEFVYTMPRSLTGHARMYPAHFAALMLIVVALMWRQRRFRFSVNIAGIVVAAATALWWKRTIVHIKNLPDPLNPYPILPTNDPVFHTGSLLFGVGILLVVTAMIAVTIRDMRHGTAA